MDITQPLLESRRRDTPILRWLETLIVTAACFGLGAWNQPADPFYIGSNFPWPVIGPLLVSLRYGFFMALVSSAMLLAGLAVHLQFQNGSTSGFPLAWSVGVLAIPLVAGEFQDYWERQHKQLLASNHYRQARLEEFTRNYYLLKVSHDRLEQQVAGSSSSLREALQRLQAEIGACGQPQLDRTTAAAMLQVLERYGQLQNAGILAVHQGRLAGSPIATLGRFTSPPENDPLIRHALKERKLISIQTEYRQGRLETNTALLAAIPLIDSNQQFIGLCAIEAMPFFSFEPQTLRFLAILAGHMADMVTEQAASSSGSDPEQRNLWRHLARVGRDAELYALPAALVGLTITDDARAPQVVELVRSLRRGLDVILVHHNEHQHKIILLLPLTDELGLAAQLRRLEAALQEQRATALGDLNLAPQTLQISSRDQSERWVGDYLADV